MTLAEFFLALATDPELLARFTAEPELVSREFGLDEKQLQLVSAGDLKKIRVKVDVELEVGDEIVAFQTVHTVPTVHLTPPPES